MGSPVFVASGAVQRFGPGDGVINLAVPTVVANDGLFLFWMEGYGPSSSGVSPGPGWGSPIASVAVGAFNRGFRVYYRLAGGSEPATYPVQQTASTSEADQAFIAAWHDPDGGPVSVDAIAASASGTSPTPTLNSVAASVANTTLVGWITGGQTLTEPSGMTVRFNRTTTAQMNLCDLAVASAGATGAKNWTCTNTDYTSFGFTIKGASSGPVITGTIAAGDFTFTGAFASAPASSLLGTITLDDFALSGTLGLLPGRVDTEPFKNWTGTLLPGVTVPNVVFLKLDRTMPLALTDQVTAGDAVMTVENAALVTGTYYIMVSYNADGSECGAELVLAA